MLEKILNLPSNELRREILTYWESHIPGQYLTMGVLLTKVKKEKLAQMWGYPKYSHYLVKELNIIPPSVANYWTGTVSRLKYFFNFSEIEMEELEKKIPQNLMAVSLRYAESRQELESIWEQAEYKPLRGSKIDKQKLIEQKGRKAVWRNLFFNDQEAILLESLTNFLRIRYELPIGGEKRSRVVLVLALVYKALIEHGKEMEKWLTHQLTIFNLPVEIADIKGAMFSVPKNENKMEHLAEELLRKKIET